MSFVPPKGWEKPCDENFLFAELLIPPYEWYRESADSRVEMVDSYSVVY